MTYHFYQKEWNLKKTKTEYVINIKSSKQTLNHGLILKKVHRVIKFHQNAWLKPYFGMHTKLRQKAKNDFDKVFFKFINNAVSGNTIENARNCRNVKLVRRERRRHYLLSEQKVPICP